MLVSRAAWFFLAVAWAGCVSSSTGNGGNTCGETACSADEVCVTIATAGCQGGQGTGGCPTITTSDCRPVPSQCASNQTCGCVGQAICAANPVSSCSCDADGCVVDCEGI